MKKIIITLMTALPLLSAGAQEKAEVIVVSAGQFRNIVLADEMDVVLMQASAQHPMYVTKEVSDKLKLQMNGEALHIEAAKVAGKFTVFLLVHDLKELTLGGHTSVQTRGVLNTGQLQVFLQDGATASLKTTGKVKAHPLGINEISISKRVTGILLP